MKKSLTYLFIFSFILSAKSLYGQKDTEFWFVAPEISIGTVNYDRPTALKFSTYDASAIITVSQPANPAFTVQTISLPANTSGSIQFSNVDNIENTPANTILNRGLLITATAPISAYYEIIGGCGCNPEIFSMKGKNALGTNFYVPFPYVAKCDPCLSNIV